MLDLCLANGQPKGCETNAYSAQILAAVELTPETEPPRNYYPESRKDG
jgi:hypothetical protein